MTLTEHTILEQRIILFCESYLRSLLDRSPGTINFYTKKLLPWVYWCEDHGIYDMDQLSADVLREYILHLQKSHNPGGVHAAFRCMRSFLRWYELETDHTTAIRKIRLKNPVPERLDPVPISDIKSLLSIANVKEKAIILFLYDTGIRAREWSVLTRLQYDAISGETQLTDTKNHQPRKVFLGSAARKAVRLYLETRTDTHPALFVNRYGTYYTSGGIQHLLARLCKRAKIRVWYPHAFRRSYALNCLRSGMDIYTLQLLMGHADLQILRRYLKQTEDDLRLAARYSPGDQL